MPNRHTGKVLYLDEVDPNQHYELQIEHHFGIDKDSCNSEQLTMSLVRIAPGNRARAHYHVNAELGMYIIQGTGKQYFGYGVEGEEEVHDIRPGTFIYVPRGVIHVIENTGTEDIVQVTAYGTANSGEATGKYFSESPIKE